VSGVGCRVSGIPDTRYPTPYYYNERLDFG
jgi:hypothetical protein